MEVDNVQSEVEIGLSIPVETFSHHEFFSTDSELDADMQFKSELYEEVNYSECIMSEGDYSETVMSSDLLTEEEWRDNRELEKEASVDGSLISRKGDSYYLISNSITKKKKFICINCHSSFASKWSLLKHRTAYVQESDGLPKFACNDPKDGLSDGVYNKVCQICNKYFKRAHLLRAHVKIHFGQRDFICTVCNKSFSQGSHLKNHTAIHTGEKNFACTVCEKKFKQSGHLLNHMRTHTGEKKFICDICNKRFTQNIHLQSHIKTHTGERDHRCILCGKYFTQSGHLLMHMRIHTGERRFSCKICSMKFKQSGHLSAHMKLHDKTNKTKKEPLDTVRLEKPTSTSSD